MTAMRAGALLAVVLLGCAADIQVRPGYDPNYDFGRLRWYAWLPREPSGDPRIDDERLEGSVRGGVDELLGAKGYAGAPEDRADFLLGYRAVLGSQRTTRSGEAFEGIWTEDHAPRGPEGGQVDTVVQEGILVLRMFDGKTRELVWEASAETEINPKGTDLDPTREDKLRAALRKMLEGFPP
jgi:hypothetical protein